MRRTLAHTLRRAARVLIRWSNKLEPIVPSTWEKRLADGFAKGVPF